MRRLLVLLAFAVALAGCKGSSATNPLDPFSRTRIEPPRTGWISDQPAADPYYSGTRQAAAPPSKWRGAGSSAAPPVTIPTTGNRYTPPSGLHQRAETTDPQSPPLADHRTPPIEIARSFAPSGPGDRISIPLAARSTSDLSTTLASNRTDKSSRPDTTRIALSAPHDAVAATPSAVATTVSAAFPASHRSQTSPGGAASGNNVEPERIVRTLGPRPETDHADAQSAGFSPGSAEAALPRGAIDIMDLPPVRSRSSVSAPKGTSPVRLASAEIEITSPPAASATPRETRNSSFSPQGRYGYDPDYRWLKGKLEFSQIDRRWKLRYIPIDGTTDEFGGSVVLSDRSLPEGCERGDFVEVHGALGAPAPDDDTTYAPEFQVRQIAGLGN
ncbi:MAG: hypothetical protein HQ582_15230 [Planctomycetes bacterium]|nr:hypothetical protein [Planctomycetota bacterium]